MRLTHASPVTIALVALVANACRPLENGAGEGAAADVESTPERYRAAEIVLPARVSVPLDGLAAIAIVARGAPSVNASLSVDPSTPGLVVVPDAVIPRHHERGWLRVGANAPLTVGATFTLRVTARWGELVRTAETSATVVDKAGALDPSFGGTGTFDVGGSKFSYHDGFSDVRVQPDGSVLGTGPFSSGSRSAFRIVHALADGRPDPAWAALRGFETWHSYTEFIDLHPRGASRRATSFAIGRQSTGRIIVAGVDRRIDAPARVALAAVEPEGALDTTFGDGGARFLSPDGGEAAALALAVAPDDTLVVAGYAGRHAMVARLTPDGAPDPRFARGGFAVLDPVYGATSEAHAVALDDAGQVIVAGDAGKQAFVAQVSAETGGDFPRVTILPTREPTDEASVRSMRVTPRGTILLGGTVRRGGNAFVAMWSLLQNGKLDPAFGPAWAQDGLITFPVDGQKEPIGGFTLVEQGRIMLAINVDTSVGDDAEHAKPYLLRLIPRGLPDTSFGSGGFVRIPLPEGDLVRSIDRAPDGKLVLGLRTRPAWEYGQRLAAIARIWD